MAAEWRPCPTRIELKIWRRGCFCWSWIEAFEHFGKTLDFQQVRHQIGKGGDLLVPDLLNAREMRRFGEELKKFGADLYKKKYMLTVEPCASSIGAV